MVNVTRGKVDVQRLIAEQAVRQRVAVEDLCYLVVLFIILRIETDDLTHIGGRGPTMRNTDVSFGLERG